MILYIRSLIECPVYSSGIYIIFKSNNKNTVIRLDYILTKLNFSFNKLFELQTSFMFYRNPGDLNSGLATDSVKMSF